MAVVCNPTRMDPWGAVCAKNILTARSLLLLSADRVDAMLLGLAAIQIKGLEWHQAALGPHAGLLGALNDVHAIINLDVQNRDLVIVPERGPKFSLFHPATKYVRGRIELMVRGAILQGLADAVNGVAKPRRKDMVGISDHVDFGMTTANLKVKKSPIAKLPVGLFRQLAVSLVTGSFRTGDRLKAGNMSDTDVCPVDGQRHTIWHLVWQCGAHDDVPTN